MYYFIAEDIFYYQNLNLLKKEYQLNDILVFPSHDDIKNNISVIGIAFIAPYYPAKEIRSLFVIIHLKNQYGILTTQEKEANMPESKALESRLGLSVIKSPFSLKNVGGANGLKEWTKELLKAEKKGFKAKAVFLVGVPGTGKTFFPKCFAGETKRLLIQLNLTLIMESEEPIYRLNRIFEYLTQRYLNHKNEKYVILIDEIEKMIGNSEPTEKRMIGRLLTILNDMHTEASEYQFDAIFFATANNLNAILNNNPELLRRGRFDELFFINLPSIEMAKSVFSLYIKKFHIESMLNILSIDDLLAEIEVVYQESNSQGDKFPYTSSEIETFCKKIYFYKIAYGKLQKEHIQKSIEMIIPIIKSAREGVNTMVAQKELFLEI